MVTMTACGLRLQPANVSSPIHGQTQRRFSSAPSWYRRRMPTGTMSAMLSEYGTIIHGEMPVNAA